MSLQWSGEIRGILDNAERDAHRMRVRMNTALILRSMLKTSGRVQDLLFSAGVKLLTCEQGLKNLQLQPEKMDAPERVYDRATRLCMNASRTEVTSLDVLLAMLDESCLAQSLLTGLQYNLSTIRAMVCGCSENERGIVYSQRSGSQSVLVQLKSPMSHSSTVIETQPAACFGSENFLDSLRNDSRQTISARNRLLTPADIASLSSSGLHPAITELKKESTVRSSSSNPSVSERRCSSTYRANSREIQQAATIDLARRLSEKKSRTSESRHSSQELKRADMSDENKASQIDNKLNSTEKITQSIETTKADEVSVSEVTAVGIEPAREIRPIVSRRNMQTINSSGTVLTHRMQSLTKLPPGFNPIALNKARFPMLCTFGRNLLAEAAAGRLDPVMDRDQEIDQLIDVLNKRRSNNPILVGEAGVGKTAIIEGLALRMARSTAPRGLEHRTIIALDYGTILCGTQLRGAVQDRIKAIKNEVSSAQGRIILFLDEIHCWLASGNGDPNSDAAQELKMALSRGELLCIGASTPQELRRAFNNDPAFERRFDFIEVKAPTPETSIRIIRQGIIEQYAKHHEVQYDDDAIRDAVRLSERYIQERALPDKAISVLDRAGSLCERAGEHVVTSEHVAQVIAQIAEVPVERLMMTEKQKLMKMEEILGKRLIGHEKNIARISSVIRRNHAGFAAKRPIGTFLFLGPTGVGKTEAAKVLADFLFGSPKNMIRFDMSEYMEQHSVAKLIGAPAGYVGFDEGGLLTEALRKRPYQIVLFDEIEKAHPDVMNIFLQIFDEGTLTDAKGRHVDFSNTVIIMTSNLGAAEVLRATQNAIGFSGVTPNSLSQEEAENIIIRAAKEKFPPELWNRIEERLVFHPLTIHQIEKIAKLLLEDSRRRLLNDKRIDLTFDEDVLIPYLVQNGGFDPKYGARPMRQTIQSLVESKVAEWILTYDELPKALFVGVKDDVVYVEKLMDSL